MSIVGLRGFSGAVATGLAISRVTIPPPQTVKKPILLPKKMAATNRTRSGRGGCIRRRLRSQTDPTRVAATLGKPPNRQLSAAATTALTRTTKAMPTTAPAYTSRSAAARPKPVHSPTPQACRGFLVARACNSTFRPSNSKGLRRCGCRSRGDRDRVAVAAPANGYAARRFFFACPTDSASASSSAVTPSGPPTTAATFLSTTIEPKRKSITDFAPKAGWTAKLQPGSAARAPRRSRHGHARRRISDRMRRRPALPRDDDQLSWSRGSATVTTLSQTACAVSFRGAQ